MADERKHVTPHSVEGVVERATKIYDENYRERYERDHAGMFVVIDVQTSQAYLGKTSGEALGTANEKAPNGVFHLMRVGQETAFRMSDRRYRA